MPIPNFLLPREALHHEPYFRLAAAETRWLNAHVARWKGDYVLVCGNSSTRMKEFQAF